jgi:hypothetical protein
VNKQVLNEKCKVFIDTSLEVRLWSKWNYVINKYSQATNSSILKNLCQIKQETHMNKKKFNTNLVQQLWLGLNQERIDQVLLVSIGYIWKQLDHKKKFLKNESMEDMECCVRQDGSWRRINKDLATMNHASEKSKRESWHWGIECDGEGQVDVQSEESCYYEESYITKWHSLLNQDMMWHGDQKWKLIIWCEVLHVTTSKESMLKQDQMWQPSWSQKGMK